jgi:hypothetical protein
MLEGFLVGAILAHVCPGLFVWLPPVLWICTALVGGIFLLLTPFIVLERLNWWLTPCYAPDATLITAIITRKCQAVSEENQAAWQTPNGLLTLAERGDFRDFWRTYQQWPERPTR